MKCESCGKESVGSSNVCPDCGKAIGVLPRVVAVPGEVVRDVTKGSVDVGTSVVKGTEIVGHDIAKGTVEVGQAIVNSSEVVGHDIAEAGREIGRGTEEAIAKVGDHLKPHAIADPVAP
jgi:hypothetical protein